MRETRRVPEVVASDETLEACADIRVAKVLSELDGLVARAVSVAEVRALGVAQVDAEALRRAGESKHQRGFRTLERARVALRTIRRHVRSLRYRHPSGRRES